MSDQGQALEAAVKEIQELFAITPADVNKIADTFVEQATAGLVQDSVRGLPMIPTYVTGVPTGKEKGLYLAADLGGTNFRVCSVDLDGNHHYVLEQQKWPVPKQLLDGEAEPFFAFLASKVKEFLCHHHVEHFAAEAVDAKVELKMGFTFSFPVKQTSINHGTLIRWTKGFNIEEAVGMDVCAAFQDQLNKLHLRVHIAALINDTVGALMARAYTNRSASQTMVGAIFGTGTNAAYFESIEKIKKIDGAGSATGTMAVNTEWGSFDNDLTVLPNNKYDKAVDLDTPNKTFHMYEKRISGLYLGELVRRVLHDLHERGILFQGAPKTETGTHNLKTPFAVDTSYPSKIEADETPDLETTEALTLEFFGYATTVAERKAIKAISNAVGTRSAWLSAAAVAGLLKQTNALGTHETVDIGGDGSVFEFYPRFQENMRAALAHTFIGKDVHRISFGDAKDGSGIGAALCARMA